MRLSKSLTLPDDILAQHVAGDAFRVRPVRPGESITFEEA